MEIGGSRICLHHIKPCDIAIYLDARLSPLGAVLLFAQAADDGIIGESRVLHAVPNICASDPRSFVSSAFSVVSVCLFRLQTSAFPYLPFGSL